MTDLERLRAAFPQADEVGISSKDYGFHVAAWVKRGAKIHAVNYQGDIESALECLGRFSGMKPA